MLSRLSIQNYAIIDELEIDFSKSLNIITGETGAGKSIIVGALGLIMGERAESGVLLKKDKKCIVEGIFQGATQQNIIDFFHHHELDLQDEIVVRREISINGKSRAFINDTPVNLSQLSQLSNMLVDLHQQFDTIDLGQADFQREVMDALAGNSTALQSFAVSFRQLTQLKTQLKELEERKENFSRELDYNQFQFNELEEANFRENELEDLDQELKMLSNAEGISKSLEKIIYELDEGDAPVLSKLKLILQQLHQYQELLAGLPSLAERVQSAFIELQDVRSEISYLKDKISFDESSLERINDRISLGYKLLKKHGVKTTAELLSIQNELQKKLNEVLNIDDTIAEIKKQYDELYSVLINKAAQISQKRKAQVKPFEKKVNDMLAQVGMPNARIRVDISNKELQVHGTDEISILFDANKSNQFHPLRKVASGGELSRLMLCIKSLVAGSMDMPTLIFDEIDTGISGEAAKQVGIIMKELSSERQVICITHQPQIAGKADAHYFVFKEVKDNVISTGVKLLSRDERIVAIARMLSGEKPTAAALENAKEMIMN